MRPNRLATAPELTLTRGLELNLTYVTPIINIP